MRRVRLGRLVQVPAGAVHVRQDGPVSGPGDLPVAVLLHGFGSSMHAFDRVVPLLAAGCHVVRVDLLGHGWSPGAAPRFDSDAQAGMVRDVLDVIGVEGHAVVGHSFGADVAIALAEQTGSVARLVVIGQAPDYRRARIPRGGRLLGGPPAGPVLARLVPAALVRRAARFAFAPGVRADRLFDAPGRLVEDVRATAPAMYRTVLVDRPRRLAERGLDQRLRALGLPTLVLLGAQDQLYPALPTRARYAGIPGVRVETLGGSGHSPNLEQPTEVAALVREFLAQR